MSELTEYEAAVEAAREPKEERVVITARSEFGDRLAVVTRVIEAYLRIRYASSICAVDLNPQPESRSLKWTVNGCHYICDIESCLRRFLVLRPDRIRLRAAWDSLLERTDYSKVSGDEKTLVMALAPIFVRTGLESHVYSRTIKKRGRA